jgi:hypothetical protein
MSTTSGTRIIRCPGCGRQIKLIGCSELPASCPASPGESCRAETQGERATRQLSELSRSKPRRMGQARKKTPVTTKQLDLPKKS